MQIVLVVSPRFSSRMPEPENHAGFDSSAGTYLRAGVAESLDWKGKGGKFSRVFMESVEPGVRTQPRGRTDHGPGRRRRGPGGLLRLRALAQAVREGGPRIDPMPEQEG